MNSLKAVKLLMWNMDDAKRCIESWEPEVDSYFEDAELAAKAVMTVFNSPGARQYEELPQCLYLT